MTALFLLTSLALAGDYDGIVKVPEGAVVTFPTVEEGTVADPWTVQHFGYFMPESYYDKALSKSDKLALCQPALDQCTVQATFWLEQAKVSLDKADKQMEADEEWQNRALLAEDKNKDLRAQRNTAWAVAGGMVLSAVAVSAVAFGL